MSSLSAYHRRLFVFLSVASFFEGFDYYALAQLLPEIRAAFSLSVSQGTQLASFVNLGMVLSFFLARQADRFGRSRLLVWTLSGYMACTGLSALAQTAWQFGLCQLLARLFQSAEVATVMVFAAEEFPKERRGFVLGVIQGQSALGAIVCAGVTPFLVGTRLGFRTVYVVGSLPLLLVLYLRRNVRDSARFQPVDKSQRLPLLRLVQSRYLPRLLLLSAIWAGTMFCTQSAILFFKDFAVTVRGFTNEQVAHMLTIAAAGSLPLGFGVGKVLDVLGRRLSTVLVFGLSIGGLCISYTDASGPVLTVGLWLGIAGTTCMLAVLQTLTTELFPTHIRAEAFGVAGNLIGKFAGVVSPLCVGMLSLHIGYGRAVQATALGPFLALVLILVFVTETKGKDLDETSAL
ncbi:MAG TPA: MFS transporter [Pseudomonadota bacterium]|nr:MFS transporter [Pseudomonadota bacterium]